MRCLRERLALVALPFVIGCFDVDTEASHWIDIRAHGDRVLIAVSGTEREPGDCHQSSEYGPFYDCTESRESNAKVTSVRCEPATACDSIVLTGRTAQVRPAVATVTVVAEATFDGVAESNRVEVTLTAPSSVIRFQQHGIPVDSVLEGTAVDVCLVDAPDPSGYQADPATGVLIVAQGGQALPIEPTEPCVRVDDPAPGMLDAHLAWLGTERSNTSLRVVRAEDIRAVGFRSAAVAEPCTNDLEVLDPLAQADCIGFLAVGHTLADWWNTESEPDICVFNYYDEKHYVDACDSAVLLPGRFVELAAAVPTRRQSGANELGLRFDIAREATPEQRLAAVARVTVGSVRCASSWRVPFLPDQDHWAPETEAPCP